ncbi:MULTISPECIES: hypothetical protein [unclassified Oleiphilus]|uniref:hypothetical protein n=1 Tax=unclassified Oleiphilus TaxID=2631174 RepID=UPI0007C2E4A6|nr:MULTISPECIES: hypothetical protein [unclassified Oleiphilus]KZY37734.1 hypothetical protein A3729_16425 [Oleiphilus sp. HI0043]KZZ67915.1 hypothetical protein A3763_15270 [Oleiphilus sp. HI0128]
MSSDSMWKYSRHIESDIQDVILLVLDTYGEEAVQELMRLYRELSVTSINSFINQNAEVISEFVGKTRSQRPAFIRKIVKKKGDVELQDILELFACIIAAMQKTSELMDIRDRFSEVFSPGASYRQAASQGVLATRAILRSLSSTSDLSEDVLDTPGIAHIVFNQRAD